MLAKIIKDRREEMKLTQEELALVAKTTQATISRIEAGGQIPSPPTLFNIARALGLEPARLLEVTVANWHADELPETK